MDNEMSVYLKRKLGTPAYSHGWRTDTANKTRFLVPVRALNQSMYVKTHGEV